MRWLIGLLILVPQAAGSAVLLVPEDHPTIQAAVDAAAVGDSVSVGPGTWSDISVHPTRGVSAVLFPKSGVTVFSRAGAALTTLECPTGACTVICAYYDAGPDTARIEGFTFSGPTGGIYAERAGPLEIRGCAFRELSGLAIQLGLWSEASVFSSTIDGSPTFIWNAYISFTDVRFQGEGSYAFEGRGDLGSRYGGVTMDRCVVNGFEDGAVKCTGLAEVYLSHCTFQNNGTYQVYDRSILDLRNCLKGNISHCLLISNPVRPARGVYTDSYLSFANNVFVNCSGSLGAAVYKTGNDAGLHHNIFVDSQVGDRTFATVYMPVPALNPMTGCNLFFSNSGLPDYYGSWTPPATDLHADPEFCDEQNGRFTVSASSPAAPGNSACAPVGALGVGCGPVAVDDASWGSVKGRYR